MSLEERRVALYECPDCGDVYFSEDATCCRRTLESVDTAAVFDPPDVESLARDVFDVSATELVICRELMAAEEATVRDLARQLSRDRSVIQRHVSHLDELGLIEKRSRSLPDGGRANVYAPKPVDEVRRRLQVGLYAWTTEAETRIDDLTREKVESMVEGAEITDVDEGDASETTRELVAENGGVDRMETTDDRSLVARLVDRWKLR